MTRHGSTRVGVALLCLALCGCAVDGGLTSIAADGSDVADAAMDTDGMAGVVDLARPGPDGGCPTPRPLELRDVPRGYLAPIEVQLDHPVDGDTVSIKFPQRSWGAPETHAVRLLYVNTEESKGADTTQFGIDTAKAIAPWVTGAQTITVVVREDTKVRGTPDLDLYGRYLGLVFLDGALMQQRLVIEGWSAYFTEFGCAPEPLHSTLLWSESAARDAQVGIWAPGHPTDYAVVLDKWIGASRCRPNPYKQPYCR